MRGMLVCDNLLSPSNPHHFPLIPQSITSLSKVKLLDYEVLHTKSLNYLIQFARNIWKPQFIVEPHPWLSHLEWGQHVQKSPPSKRVEVTPPWSLIKHDQDKEKHAPIHVSVQHTSILFWFCFMRAIFINWSLEVINCHFWFNKACHSFIDEHGFEVGVRHVHLEPIIEHW